MQMQMETGMGILIGRFGYALKTLRQGMCGKAEIATIRTQGLIPQQLKFLAMASTTIATE